MMQKIEATSPEAQSADLVADNIAQLRALFPELLTETASGAAVNIDVLKALVGDKTATDAEEKYGLSWHGKRAARQLALTPSIGTLRPCPSESVDWDATQNLMIEGDNLEVLKLLQKSYAGKVKLIYIDPPYNTGSDFVYPDNFQDNVKNYLELTGQIESGKKISSNVESGGRFHTDWLNMMYPRLKLARNLLDKDGLIIAQISDTELHNLRRVLDELFGEENYINTIAVQTKVAAGASGGGEDKRLKKNMEYLLVYAKTFDFIEGFANNYVDTPLMQVVNDMRDAGESWKYTSVIVDFGTKTKIKTVPDGDGNPIDIFICENIKRSTLKELCKAQGITEEQGYRKYLSSLFSDTNAQTSIRARVIDATGPLQDGQMYAVEYVPTSGREKGKKACHYYISPTVRRVIWLKDVAFEKNGVVIKRERTGTLWNDIEYNNIGKEGDVAFSNGKKPVDLLKRVIGLAQPDSGLFLDYFAGSGTFAHAVMSFNAEQGGSRRFAVVQLPEPVSSDHDEQKVAADFCAAIEKPRTIAELTKERLRRSAAKVKTDNPLFSGDTGFRVFKLDSSNIRAWNPIRDNLARSLLDNLDHVYEGRSNDDVLYELLLKLGLDLCVPVNRRAIGSKTVHSIGGGVLIACLDTRIATSEAEALALGIAQWREELNPAGETTCVFRDSAFQDDVAKSNLAAILEQHGIGTVRSL